MFERIRLEIFIPEFNVLMVAIWYVILGFMMGDLGVEDELSFEGKIFFF